MAEPTGDRRRAELLHSALARAMPRAAGVPARTSHGRAVPDAHAMVAPPTARDAERDLAGRPIHGVWRLLQGAGR
eukprot:3549495-Pyramimonas_sp.AAC.1